MKDCTILVSDEIAKKIMILRRKQEFIGDNDDDES